MDYSVVIVGGGPAGALAALRLTRSGARVLVVDRERPARPEAAEILAPEGQALLAREQVWPHLPADLFRPCSALGVAWDSPAPTWTDFTQHPAGQAWHLDRIRFDAWMTTYLRSQGVAVETGRVDTVARDAERWHVAFSRGGTSHRATASCLLLATGRTGPAIRLAPRHRIDTLCLAAGTSAPDPRHPDALIVEAAVDGWWYSAPLVDGRLFWGWMTDFSLVAHGRYADAAAASLAQAPLHAGRIRDARFTAAIGSAAWAMTPAAGPGWMAIGDAALARDPIGGDGLTAALRSASHAADVVMRALGGDRSAWASAASDLEVLASEYRQRRQDLYRLAMTRWPASPFWRRFAAAPAAPAHHAG